MNRQRFGIALFFFLFFFSALLLRIIFLTLLPDPRFKAKLSENTLRGSIYDKYNKELAIPSTVYSLYVRPGSMKAALRDELAYTLKKSSAFTTAELSALDSDKNFVWIKRRIGSAYGVLLKDWIKTLREKKIIQHDEIGLIADEGRLYLKNELSGAIGVVGVDNHGLSGLEYSFHEKLSQGYNITTSLDGTLSSIAYQELEKAVLNNQAESASCVIMDIKTREVLSLISYPAIDPNDNRAYTPEKLHLKALSSVFEPGSVMKQFSAAYALEKARTGVHYPVYYCSGEIDVSGYPFSCDPAHGKVDLARVIQKSCNVGMIQFAETFRKDDFYHFLRSFGFGKTVDIEIKDNTSGILRDPQRWSGLSKYMISIGQEIGVTALQLAIASTIIGSEGYYKQPTIIREIRKPDGSFMSLPERSSIPVISSAASHMLLDMMQTVVSENGTAIAARIDGINISGKTGTGQVARESGGGYYPDIYNSVFVGYVPSEKPAYSIVIVIHKPKGDKHTGGLVAAPVFSSIVRRMIVSTPYFTAN